MPTKDSAKPEGREVRRGCQGDGRGGEEGKGKEGAEGRGRIDERE